MGALRRLPLVLVLGFVTTVGVAWGFAFTSIDGVRRSGLQYTDPVWRQERVDERDYSEVVSAVVTRTWGSVRVRSSIVGKGMHLSFGGPPNSGKLPLAEEVVPRWAQEGTLPWIVANRPVPMGFEYRSVIARGWPFVALYSGTEMDDLMKELPRGEIPLPWKVSVQGTHVVMDGRETPVSLPYLPVWTGLMMNTAVYGVTWGLILVVPGVLRRWIRHARGLCVGCGYDARGLGAAPCPECGWHACSPGTRDSE